MRQVASRVPHFWFCANAVIGSALVWNLPSSDCACYILLPLLRCRWEHRATGVSRGWLFLAREEWNSLHRIGTTTELLNWDFVITSQTRNQETSGYWQSNKVLCTFLLGSLAFIADKISWIWQVRYFLKLLACRCACVKRCD